jgi:hypothetical protein
VAKLEERLRWEKASAKREKRMTEAAGRRMRQELVGLREGLERTRDRVQPGAIVRSYLYPDGRAIAAVRFLVPRRGSIQSWLWEVHEEWSPYPRGTWLEASFLFPPKADPWQGEKGKAYHAHYQGMLQIQTFGTPSDVRLFMTLAGSTYEKGKRTWNLLQRLLESGYPRPSEILFRVGRSVDDSKPFLKKKPPA